MKHGFPERPDEGHRPNEPVERLTDDPAGGRAPRTESHRRVSQSFLVNPALAQDKDPDDVDLAPEDEDDADLTLDDELDAMERAALQEEAMAEQRLIAGLEVLPLEKLAPAIREEADRSRQLLEEANKAALRAGLLVVMAKSQLKDGVDAWIKQKVGFSVDEADMYYLLVKMKEEFDAKAPGWKAEYGPWDILDVWGVAVG